MSVSTYVRVADDGEGQKIIPLFAAFQKRLKGFGKTNIVSVIPATDKFAHNDAGQWFVNRHEVLPGTEIMIEYRNRASTGFRENIDHLLLIAEPNAPLWQLRIDLPPHFLSNVPNVFFEGRFELVRDDKQLTERALFDWRKHIGADDPALMLADYMDPSMAGEDQVFRYIELEGAVQAAAKLEIKEDAHGGSTIKIKRGRRIKIR